MELLHTLLIGFLAISDLSVRRNGFLLTHKVSPEEEFQKQQQITPVHNQGRHIVFGTHVATIFLGVQLDKEQIIRHGGTNNADDHLRDLCCRNNHGIQPLGLQT